MSTSQKQRFKGSGGNPRSPGAFGTFLVEKYIENFDRDAVASVRNFNDAMVRSRRSQTMISGRME